MASGDKANTSQDPKPTGKKGKKLTQKEQSERFIETARTFGGDEREDVFDKIFKKIVPPKS